MKAKYGILIADDEKRIRNGLANSIDWDKIDCRVVAVAEDGKDAIEKAQQYKPDIIITDINMPVMNGLEFCRKLKEIQPDAEIIILTGYDEFDYARESIQIGVMEFLVKPVSNEDIMDTVAKARDLVRKKKENAAKILEMEKHLKHSNEIMKNYFIQDVLQGKYAREEIRDKMQQYGIETGDKCFRVAVLAVQKYKNFKNNRMDYFKEVCMPKIQQIITDFLKDGLMGPIVWDGSERIAFICQSPKHLGEGMKVIKKLEEIKSEVEEQLNFEVSLALGDTVGCFENVYESFYKAQYAMDYGQILGDNGIIDFNELITPNKFLYSPLIDNEIALYRALRDGNRERVQELMNQIHGSILERSWNDRKHATIVYSQIIIMAARILHEILGNAGEINTNGTKINFQEHLNYIVKLKSHRKLNEYVKIVLDNVCLQINSYRNTGHQKIINKAIEFIHANYSKAISLKDIANHVYMTPTYFSYIFKKETGENVSTYLNQVRIEKAKELLRDETVKTYEVAYQVGFNDPNYFYVLFKKYTGCTPGEYRQKI